MVTLSIFPDDKVIKSDVFDENDIIVVMRGGLGSQKVYVWEADGDFLYGELDYPASEKDCVSIKTAYQRGLETGIAVGRARLQRELKGLLGVGQ